MVYGRKRLVSRAVKNLTAVSAAHLPRFPPPQATKSPRATGFDPDAWGAIQPPPPSALSAFAHRIGLGSVLTDPDLILQACTHPSAQHLARQQDPEAPPLATNAHLGALGNALMGLFATEYVHASYPYLPPPRPQGRGHRPLSPKKWAPSRFYDGTERPQTQQRPTNPRYNAPTRSRPSPRALTALIYQHRSLPSARQFVHSYFLSREVDIRSMIKFVDPKKALKEMVTKFGREPPKSRLLKETGRFSNSPVFVVGIYSGNDKLGEGFGASLKMAEYRKLPSSPSILPARLPISYNSPPLPSPSALAMSSRTETPENAYIAPELEQAEIMYASGGHTGHGVVAPQRIAS
ncbi:60S ribosomal protein L3 [Mycena venus]|uniref:Large ribosomal subunit protein mL44 n=1 Tax=Mycena venus TaxID=2733690 RepID=A0A8H7D2U4_9AGAR|nr:60S ribosomal protein L3 [Mycena venus]